jgi:virginiamycin A acetyltransferase
MIDKTTESFWRRDALAKARRVDSAVQGIQSRVLLRLYRFRALRGICLKLCNRLEHGAMFSATLRRLLWEYHGVEVGRYSYGDVLKPGSVPHGTRVGNWCSVGTGLIIRRRDHPIDRPFLHPVFYNSRLGFLEKDTIADTADNPLFIGHDVWIGDRVTILGGCRFIGNGAVLAAGAVVTRDVAPYSVVGGVPARVVKMRFSSDRIDEIENSRWWDRDLASIIADPPVSGIFG